MLTRRTWRKATRSYHVRTPQRLTRLAASPHALEVRSWHVSHDIITLPAYITNIQILGVYQRLTTLHLHCMAIYDEFRARLSSLPILEDLTLRTCTLKFKTGPAFPLRMLTILSGVARSM